MPASIFGNRFLGRREPAWHGLGTVFDYDAHMTVLEAIVRAGCDYEVRKLPLTVTLPNGEKRRTDQVAIVRLPTHDEGSYHVMGYANEGYELVQNVELAFMLEDLAKEWPVETVGALGEGETAFVCLMAGEDEVVKGASTESIKRYLVMSNSHDGKRSLRISLTDVRTVCQNTLMAGHAAAVVTTSIPHRSDIRDEADFRLKLIGQVRKGQQAMLEQYRRMAVTKVVDAQVDEILKAAYPDPKPWRKQLVADIVINDEALNSLVQDNRAVADRLLSDLKMYGSDFETKLAKQQNLRDLARERIAITAEESPVIAGTAWCAWQGVTEVESYRGVDDKPSKKTGRTPRQSAAMSVMFGERAATMGRAYAKAWEMCAE